jgi:NodT family efflux transporter outer membrane factor (OMF) lipoprotein
MISAALTLGGCTVGPNYHAPQSKVPATYVESAASPAIERASGNQDLYNWWRQFGDGTLDALVERALAHNLTLASSASRIREARFQQIETGAAAYPSLNALGSAVAYRSNASTATVTGSAGLSLPSRLNLYALGFDASWELDLFGSTRRALEAATANSEASVWTRRDGEVSLIAELANDYLVLRAYQARITLGNAELARQQDLLALIQARRSTGFVTELDVNQQSTLVATAAAQIPQLEAEARVSMHAMGVLLGEPPEVLERELMSASEALPSPPELPPGLPSELLWRRPDIRTAERRVAAASAQIGVKTASLYPKLDLMALGSFAGMSLSDLLSRQNLIAAALGMASEPVFDGGRNRASVGEAREQYTQALLAYQATVIGALRDVEDALARRQAEEVRRERLEQAVRAAEGTLDIANTRYQTGFVPFVNVLQAQYALLNARDQLTQCQALVVTDLVALYKALGGGWSK